MNNTTRKLDQQQLELKILTLISNFESKWDVTLDNISYDINERADGNNITLNISTKFVI